ncbi:MAG: MTH1187 family thiamine-binding protein [Halobacteriales archaeon]
MTVVGFLTVAPAQDSMSAEIAKAVKALERFDVSYETTGMGTIIEAEDAATIFDAASAAHEAVDSSRVVTSLKIDDKRGVGQTARGKVESVEEHLGREAKSGR